MTGTGRAGRVDLVVRDRGLPDNRLIASRRRSDSIGRVDRTADPADGQQAVHHRRSVVPQPGQPAVYADRAAVPTTRDASFPLPYTVGQIRNAIGGDTFFVGLDLNQAQGHNGGAYTLQSFTLAVDGVTQYSTSGPDDPGSHQHGERLLGCQDCDVQPERIVRRSEAGVHRLVQWRNRRPGAIFSVAREWA